MISSSIKQNLIVFALSFILLAFLNEILIRHKINYRQVHSDEIYEFFVVLLNDPAIEIDQNNQVSNHKVFTDTFFLKPENRFNYKKLLSHPTLANDTHPYLHYLALHTIYSAFSYINDGKFTPYSLESLSGVFNAILQALSAMLMLIIFRKIYKTEESKKNNSFSLIASIIAIYLLLPVSTYLTPYARMYCLYIFTSLLYVYFLVISIHKPSIIGYLGLTLATFLGFSSHYYELLFISSFLGVYFIFNFLLAGSERKIFPFLDIVAFCLAGFALVFWVFPQTLWHLTLGHRAEQLINLLTNYWYIWTILVSIILLTLYKIWQAKPTDFVSFYNAKISSLVLDKNANIVFFGALAFYLTIMLLSPMKIMRYYAPAIPIFFIWGGISIYHSKYMLKIAHHKRKILGWSGAILLIYYTNSWILEQVYHKTFTYRESLSENVVILKPVKSSDFAFSWQDVKSYTLLDLYDPKVLAKICDKNIVLPEGFSLIDTYDLTINVRKPKPIAELFSCLSNQGYSISPKKKFSRDSDYYEVEKKK